MPFTNFDMNVIREFGLRCDLGQYKRTPEEDVRLNESAKRLANLVGYNHRLTDVFLAIAYGGLSFPYRPGRDYCVYLSALAERIRRYAKSRTWTLSDWSSVTNNGKLTFYDFIDDQVLASSGGSVFVDITIVDIYRHIRKWLDDRWCRLSGGNADQLALYRAASEIDVWNRARAEVAREFNVDPDRLSVFKSRRKSDFDKVKLLREFRRDAPPGLFVGLTN